jgi:2-keto-4-pentenoate hydratase/2-oxohepta-3-ene-1,7-dioic acid hydratase in catechol pathway
MAPSGVARRFDVGGLLPNRRGRETGRFRTNDMIFGIVPFIVELTKYLTPWPGDVIWMGTDGASPDLRAGDVVEIEITGIGTLRNKFVKEAVPGKP